jgi:hypothetical protein
MRIFAIGLCGAAAIIAGKTEASQKMHVRTPPPDSVVFRLALKALAPDSGPLHVDPRILSTDPSIGSVEDLPLPVAKAAGPEGFIDDSIGLSDRLRVLESLHIQTQSIVKAVECGANRRAALVEGRTLSTAENCFGGQSFKIALLSRPRPGGPYLPGTVDERRPFGDPTFSVRVISVVLYETGSTETSWDFVFDQAPDGSWKFVRKRPLIIAG